MNLDTLPDLPPLFDLQNVRLRALRPDDAPAWFAYLSDPAVIEQTSYDIRSLEAVHRMIANYIAAYQNKRACRWALALQPDDTLIGTCGFYKLDTTNAVAELGYDLAGAYWHQGLMTQAVRTVIGWAFEQARVNRIQAIVMVDHVASTRVLEKCGFQREGTLREYLLCRGQPRDFWMFSLLQKEYCPQNQ